ncbi:MAG TPA: DUF2975 domain-containing protein [Lacisediminihabitans sp.]|uniref:DUF2975 domain-containing protein n=1 Tax=Lacisediminihabitans sp. TaxID=2787631 RepID=UPI002ED99A10
MRRGTSTTLIVVLVLALLGCVAVEAWVFPHEVYRAVDIYPQMEPIAIPSIVWGIVATACWQAIAVIGLRLVVLSRDRRIVATDYGWLWAIVACLGAFLVLVTAAFVALIVMGYATPGVMLGLLAGGLVAFVAAFWLGLFLGTRR